MRNSRGTNLRLPIDVNVKLNLYCRPDIRLIKGLNITHLRARVELRT